MASRTDAARRDDVRRLAVGGVLRAVLGETAILLRHLADDQESTGATGSRRPVPDGPSDGMVALADRAGERGDNGRLAGMLLEEWDAAASEEIVPLQGLEERMQPQSLT